MVRQIRPASVYRAAKAKLNSPILPGHETPEPPWFKALYFTPPAETLTRPVPVRHHEPNPKARRPKHAFIPQKIVYVEDELRKTFYKDHPWELARPRVLVELDGKDAQNWDWSTGVRQPGTQLSGECVVRRQLWLMENASLSRDEAYDKARKEFYELRQEEEIERRVAKEEARYVGAYFGMGRLEIGMKLEDDEFERWKKWATVMVEKRRTAKTTEITFGGEETSELGDALPAKAEKEA